MAVVKMSKKLKEEIVRNAEKLFEPQTAALVTAVETEAAKTAVAEYLIFETENTIGYTRQAHDAFVRIAKEHNFLDPKKSLLSDVHDLAFKIGVSRYHVHDDGKVEKIHVLTKTSFSTSIPKKTYWWPKDFYGWNKNELNHPTVKFEVDEAYQPTHPVDTVLQGLFDRVCALARKEDERKKFIKLVKSTLDATNSLRQFLKAWPEGETLVPDEYLTELNRKTGRNRTNVEETLDEETRRKLSGTLLINKMQQGN